MSADEIRRRSRWMLRALEWDDPRARYPNIWHAEMPVQVLAYDTVASRLRLGDLIAVYHPSSQRHAARGERFLGLSRVVGLRRAHDRASAWVDLETAHRFRAPLDLAEAPRRVFVCCDAGWPEQEVVLFRRVFQAAVEDGWTPAPEETEAGAQPSRGAANAARGESGAEAASDGGADDGVGASGRTAAGGEAYAATAPEAGGATAPARARPGKSPAGSGRLFAGADYSEDMRDPRAGTWLAVVELAGDRLQVVRLEATGRSGFQAVLRDADSMLLRAEAFGLNFPFGLPIPFAERLLGGSFPQEGWWALAKRLDHMSRPDFLSQLEEFRAEHGELREFTDETAGGPSPLRRAEPDLGALTYHGIRMIAEERSRYAVRPFESARGRLLLEVSPSAAVRDLRPPAAAGSPAEVLEALASLPHLPVAVGARFRPRGLQSRDALDAVVAARAAAVAVLSGETERTPEDLANGHGEQVRREGWIYGLARAQ